LFNHWFPLNETNKLFKNTQSDEYATLAAETESGDLESRGKANSYAEDRKLGDRATVVVESIEEIGSKANEEASSSESTSSKKRSMNFACDFGGKLRTCAINADMDSSRNSSSSTSVVVVSAAADDDVGDDGVEAAGLLGSPSQIQIHDKNTTATTIAIKVLRIFFFLLNFSKSDLNNCHTL
jgi:hypothetical protein